jgi:hypothetical protein
MNHVIELTDDTAILRTAQPRGLGTCVELEVKLPEGVLANHLLIRGTVTRCESMDHNGEGRYMLEMKIGKMSPVDRKILVAYREYLERKRALAKVTVDLNEIQAAFESFGRNLHQLRKNAEVLRNNLRGTLELMKMKAEGKTTIH